MFASSEMTKL